MRASNFVYSVEYLSDWGSQEMMIVHNNCIVIFASNSEYGNNKNCEISAYIFPSVHHSKIEHKHT